MKGIKISDPNESMKRKQSGYPFTDDLSNNRCDVVMQRIAQNEMTFVMYTLTWKAL